MMTASSGKCLNIVVTDLGQHFLIVGDECPLLLQDVHQRQSLEWAAQWQRQVRLRSRK